MNTVLHADIFFFIATIGFVLCAVLVAMLLIVVIRLVASVHRISRKIEASIDSVGGEAKELIEDLRESAVFRFIFGGHPKAKRASHK